MMEKKHYLTQDISEFYQNNFENFKEIINLAIKTLKCKDQHLLKYDLHERAIAHRLAIYIEVLLGNYFDVDFEIMEMLIMKVYEKR